METVRKHFEVDGMQGLYVETQFEDLSKECHIQLLEEEVIADWGEALEPFRKGSNFNPNDITHQEIMEQFHVPYENENGELVYL